MPDHALYINAPVATLPLNSASDNIILLIYRSLVYQNIYISESAAMSVVE